MKKKIWVFMLLFAVLVGVGVPVQVKADDIPYAIPEDISQALDNKLSENHSSSVVENFKYYVDLIFVYDTYVDYWRFYSYEPVILTNTGYYKPSYELTNSSKLFSNISQRLYRVRYRDYFNDDTEDTFSTDWSIFRLYEDLNSSLANIVGANHSVCDENGIVIYNHYNFVNWCSDAGLNCSSSSNETEDLYYFEYDSDNWYLIRKNRILGSEYTWYLSEFRRYGSDTWHLYSTIRSMASNNLGIADLSDDLTMQSITVENYVYDSSGGGWLFVDRPSFTLQVGDNYNNDIGISFDSTMPIIYTNTSIYSDVNKSSVHIAAITEFQDVSSVEPTSTPTPTPISNSGSGGTVVGGDAKPGGMLDFLVTLVTLVWTDLFAVEVPVDGYMISFQQIVIWGAVAGLLILGGCKLFGKKG